MKILVVEDNLVNLELFRDLLEIGGHEVVEAHTGYEAIAAVGKELPDAILMDIQLPDMDGCAATEKIREFQGADRIPVIALTAHAMEGDREKALNHGCDAYISKPINTRNFVVDVEEICGSIKGKG